MQLAHCTVGVMDLVCNAVELYLYIGLQGQACTSGSELSFNLTHVVYSELWVGSAG